MSACICGEFKTSKAGPKSPFHSDWCVESPKYKPKGATVVTAREVNFTFQGQPMQFYAGSFPVAAAAPKKPDCLGCSAIYGKPIPADWEIYYPYNYNGYGSPTQTASFCDTCAPPATRNQLTSLGCKITKL